MFGKKVQNMLQILRQGKEIIKDHEGFQEIIKDPEGFLKLQKVE